MINLTREFRFCLADPDADLARVGNSWTGAYTSNLVRPFLKLRLTVSGEIQQPTGYLCNVKVLDQMVQQFVEETIRQPAGQPARQESLTYERLIVMAAEHVRRNIPTGAEFQRLELVVSPTFFYSIDQKQSSMVSDKNEFVCLTQQFEFSAAHRLHCVEFSDEQNREIFGKCNNPEGHGHNYVVEVTVGNSVDLPAAGKVVCLADFELAVKRLVIDRLDHKHLNRDVAEFADLNPSVENIAVKIWDWLDGNIPNTQLKRIRVYETPKTWAEYSG